MFTVRNRKNVIFFILLIKIIRQFFLQFLSCFKIPYIKHTIFTLRLTVQVLKKLRYFKKISKLTIVFKKKDLRKKYKKYFNVKIVHF